MAIVAGIFHGLRRSGKQYESADEQELGKDIGNHY